MPVELNERAAARAARRAERAAAPKPPSRPPRHVRRRRLLRGLSSVLILAGTGLVGDAVATVTWQEPITAFWTGRQQGGLDDDLRALRAEDPTRAERLALARLTSQDAQVAFLARSLQERAGRGEAVAKLRIPRIDLARVVVDGSQPEELRRGPGLYDGTSFPGAGGTTAIAGHRTTYGAPFRHLDRVQRGDRIELELPYGTFTYVVERSRIVGAGDVGVVRQVRGPGRLVLTACHPLFSNAQRIAVTARLVRTEPAARVRQASATPRARAASDR